MGALGRLVGIVLEGEAGAGEAGKGAFGLGIMLATQNPVDLDYKGLSNAGTWFLGRLQTERDKAVTHSTINRRGSKDSQLR